MSPIMRVFVVFAVFWFMPARAQEGHLGQAHEKWHQTFYQYFCSAQTPRPLAAT